MGLNIKNETGKLVTVVLGIAEDMGKPPSIEECIDPKTKENLINNTYPKEGDCINEIENLNTILLRNGVEVLRPNNIQNLNQIFTRDIAFVIEDKLFIPDIIKERNKEKGGIKYLLDNFEKDEKIIIPEDISIEGGDIIIHNNYIFIGYSNDDKLKVSRTSSKSIPFIQKHFPDKKVLGFDLVKDDNDPYKNILHLDCVMQPVGKDNIIIYEGGFKKKDELEKLIEIFGENSIIKISKEEQYDGCSNLFSINEKTIISDSTFTRLNKILTSKGINVEKVYYREISKYGGLFRCSTLPLNRI
tara:strand:+ start:8102 stop:9004 length:903 start_codon:yes stop_codon:yes gene_type:complete